MTEGLASEPEDEPVAGVAGAWTRTATWSRPAGRR